MDYPETLLYLDQITRSGIKYDLVNIRRLLELLGYPDKAYPVVCVAGTNGKGSVCAFLESILAEAGYRAGLNTSPHLVSPRERIRVNRVMVSPDEFAAALSEVRRVSESAWRPDDPGRPTFFETMTASALVHFRSSGADIAVLEAGLGGRLDATNATQPVLSIITRIAVDHPKTLGRSRRKIAFEKAGISRAGRPLLIGGQIPGITAHLEALGRFRGAFPTALEYRWKISGGLYELSTADKVYSGLTLSLAGEKQLENAACAVRAAELLSAEGFKIGGDAVRRGLAKAYWPGRLEMREYEGRRVLIDCAHNPDGMRGFVRELRKIGASRRILIYGTMADKEYKHVVRLLFPLVDKVLLPPLPQQRAEDPNALLAAAGRYNNDVSVTGSLGRAWEIAKEAAVKDDLIIVTGSLYLVGEFKKVVEPAVI